ncbi:MAG: single-stranded DNA-binding protein [Gammaproteobacteria bacterium]|nr:MAG: single-stranded DNA-binding protein [Gammaproteobacteria bacterium]
MLYMSAYGRFGQDPRPIETKSGNPMCVSSMAVRLYDKHGEEHTQWMSVVAFGRNAELLGRQHKGDVASVSGHCQINHWTKSDGQTQVELSIVVDSVVSCQSVRPAEEIQHSMPIAGTDEKLPDSSYAMDLAVFDDELPF